MLKIFIPITLALTMLSAYTKPLLIEGILASVNDDIILLSEFRERQIQVLRNLERQNVSPENVPNLKERLLDSMIDERLELEAAKAQNIQVTDLVLNRQISEIARRNNLTVIELKSKVQEQGEDWGKYRETLRHEILLSQLKNQVLIGRVEVTKKEIDQFLNRERFRKDPFEYHTFQILIETNDGKRTQKQSLLQAQNVYQKLKEGMPFASASAQFSDAANAISGGELGWMDASNLPDSFLQTLQKLKPSEFSMPIQSGLGYHILLLKESRNKQAVRLDRYKLQQIFLSSLNHSDKDASNTLLRLTKQIKKDPEKFSELAKVYSEDGISASNNGITPWLIQGRFNPELERNIPLLKLNQLSEPIRTQNGWYLIKVLSRENFDATDVINRERVRGFLIDQQANIEYLSYLRNLRNNAAIHIQQTALDQL